MALDQEKRERSKQLLEQALEVDAHQRSRLLEAVCDDEEVRAEVESLLRIADSAGDALQRPAVIEDVYMSAVEAGMVGQQIGHYRLIRLVGIGGMGSVFLAERADREFDQRVALKLVRPELCNQPIIDRFRSERQVLARLEHPHIARLIDGGTTNDAAPYYVLEYVNGAKSISDYCQDNNLPQRAILQLFLQVCSAVQYAHQNLIVHRDLKPSNVLVDVNGNAKLVDFGIAKLLSEGATQATLTGMMTPAYASPEQIRGGTTATATDVYSLGVMLYRLLTNRLPYDVETKTPAEVERTICESHPAPSGLGNDLDNVLLMAMRKEPHRRYVSVDRFAEDIRRFLANRPVSARRDTLLYRAAKYVRRNWISLSAAGLVAMALAAAYLSVVQARNRADNRFAQVHAVAQSLLFELEASIRDLPGATPARELVVSRALEYLNDLAAEADDPELLADLGAAYFQVAEIQGDPAHPNLGDTEGAMKSYEQALSLRERVANLQPDDLDSQINVCNTLWKIAALTYYVSTNEETLRRYEVAIPRCEAVAARFADQPDAQRVLAICLAQYADMLQWVRRHQEAQEQMKRVSSIFRQLRSQFPKETTYDRDLARALRYQGRIEDSVGNHEQAANYFDEQLQIINTLSEAEPSDARLRRELFLAHNELADSRFASGHFEVALEHYEAAHQIVEFLTDADAANQLARRDLALVLRNLGTVLIETERSRQAIPLLRQALEIDRQLLDVNAINREAAYDVAEDRVSLGRALAREGDIEGAIEQLNTALQAYREISASALTDIVPKLNLGRVAGELGQIHLANGAAELAKPLLEESAEVYRQLQKLEKLDDDDLAQLQAVEEALQQLR